jgi:DNA-binding helix-hairpin-helix protein with protein kinase domain
MRVQICDYNGQRIKKATLGNKIASGGEGEIRAIIGDGRLCAKIYWEGKGSDKKIIAMMKNRPKDPMHPNHASLAWPENLILDDGNKFLGFAMQYIQNAFPVHQAYSTDSRIKTFKEFSWDHLFTIALNFASVATSIHKKGHIIGDINESNVMVNQNALITLIDCDSFFINDGNETYKSNVGKGEYTAPEVLNSGSYESRTEESDRFAVAILIFKLLMLGFHPFHGKWKGRGESPTRDKNIKAGRTPYFRSISEIEVPPQAPSTNILPEDLWELFERAFVKGYSQPSARPSAFEWFKTLKSLSGGLSRCKNPNHSYFAHLDKCPWCEYARKIGKDPFPSIKLQEFKRKFDEIGLLLKELKALR